VPEREWIIPYRVPAKHVTLFSGEGGGGKSLTMLLASAAKRLGRDWLGLTLEPGPAMFVDAEDDKDELHRRLAATAAHFGVSFTELERSGLYLKSLACDENDMERLAVLGAFSPRTGLIQATKLYEQLTEYVGDLKPKLITIASSANVFAGNENDRGQVTQFLTLLRRWALISGGGLVLISHPSLTGIGSGSGISGSTQWHNGPRARIVLRSVKPEDDDEPPDPDLRRLDFHKNNYGPISESIFIRYQNGLFLPAGGVHGRDTAARAQLADEVFLALLLRFTEQGQVGPSPGRGYAPALFARHPEASGLTRDDLAQAMQRLLDSGKMIIEEVGPPSKRVRRLRPTIKPV
jgi:RecA-family ATPase